MKIVNFIKRKVNPIKYWKSQGVIIGSGCNIYSSADFGSEPYLVSIGNNVRINSGVHFVTHDGGAWVVRNLDVNYRDVDLIKPISIGDNCHIGTNVTIMPGVTIGSNVIIGVGAIVTKNIPNNSIAVGVPARVIETIDEYIKKHEKDFVFTKSMTKTEKKKYLINLLINKTGVKR